MRISILSIGDEILIGQIVNTNAAWMAEKITSLGAEIIAVSVVGDVLDEIMSEFERLLGKSDCVLVTGGLGPTHDDVTKEALLRFYDDKLIMNQEALEEITQLFARRGYALTERNRLQAMLPKKCRSLRNTIGTAPGMLFEIDGKFLISMPGVPAEMKGIMESFVLDFIEKEQKKRNEDVVLYKTLITAGIFESYLADLIGDTDVFLGNSTLAFLPSYRGIKLRIGAKGKDFPSAQNEIARIEKYIRSKAEQYIIAEQDIPLAEITGKALLDARKTIAVAESCTSGLLSAALTDIPGSSSYFIGGELLYSNEAKIKILGIDRKIIENHGAVSQECASVMAEHVRRKFTVDFGISITGIAGPGGGSVEKPVGTVWIGISDDNGTIAEKYLFNGNRAVIRERAVGMALTMLLNRLKNIK